MKIESLLSRLPAELAIPSFAEMRERTKQLQGSRGVEIQTIGEDREGEPIELISLGTGPKSVLVVGAPHPNEPIGCIGIEWLIEQFTADAALLDESACRWHFIKAIEPYALKQNEGWFAQADVATYVQHFYRPPFGVQAEYAFPPAAGAAGSWQPVPENDAYRRALEIAQPDLLVSLHNAEGSGAFYFLSRDDAALAERLAAQALSQGLPLNLLGEEAPDVREAPLAPGVFLLLEEAREPAEPREASGLSVTAWLATQDRRAPLFLVPEVPLLVDSSTADRFRSMDDCLASVAELAWAERLDALVAERLGPLEIAATPLEQLYLRAIREMVPMFKKLLTELPQLKTRAQPDRFEAHVRAHVLMALRPMAMARRVAAMRAARADLGDLRSSAEATEQACARELSMALESVVLRNAFERVSLRAAVATQLGALLAAAETV